MISQKSKLQINVQSVVINHHCLCPWNAVLNTFSYHYFEERDSTVALSSTLVIVLLNFFRHMAHFTEPASETNSASMLLSEATLCCLERQTSLLPAFIMQFPLTDFRFGRSYPHSESENASTRFSGLALYTIPKLSLRFDELEGIFCSIPELL